MIGTTQIHPLLAPRGGLRFDLPADIIADIEMSDCLNVVFKDGLVQQRHGYPEYGSNLPLPGAVLGFDQFELFSGTKYLLCVTTKMPFKYDTSEENWETLHESEVEDDCETTWTSDMGANGAVADETTIYKVGSTSQKISPAAGFTTGLLAHRDQALGDKSAYSYVRLWIRSSVAQSSGDLQFLIDDTSGCGAPTETLDIPALTADTWKLVFLACDDPSSNMTSIASLGLKAATDNGACDIYIDDIQFVKSFSSSLADSDLSFSTQIRKSSETDPWWIFTNGVDNIKKWTGSGAVSDLISSYPSGVTALLAEGCIEFKNHLLLWDVSEDGNRYPQRIRWTDTADPEDFLNGNASYQDLTGADWIKAVLRFRGDYLVVLKEDSVWVGYATGDNDIFQFDEKIRGIGCGAPKSAVAIGDVVIFLGDDDVYTFNGLDYEKIGGAVREELFDTINKDEIGRAFAMVVEENQEYWLFVPHSSETYCDRCWVYNYRLKTWTKGQTADYVSGSGSYEKQSTLTIGDLTGTIGEQNWRFGDSVAVTGAATLILGDKDGYVYEYDGIANDDDDVAIDGWFSTKDFNFTQLMRRFRLLRLDVYYRGDGLSVQYSEDKGVTWTTIASLSASTDLYSPNRAYLREDMLMGRLRFRNNSSGEHFVFSRASLYWQPGGYRV